MHLAEFGGLLDYPLQPTAKRKHQVNFFVLFSFWDNAIANILLHLEI